VVIQRLERKAIDQAAEWLICDNEGPRSVVHGPKYGKTAA